MLGLACVLLTGCGASSGPEGANALAVTATPDANIEAPTSAAAPSTPTIRSVTKTTPREVTGLYRLGSGDKVEVLVHGVSELSRTTTITERGDVELPVLGQVPAEGMTVGALQTDIQARLAKDYMQDPQVSVTLMEIVSQQVTIEGSVRKPGLYPHSGRLSLLQAVAIAGGLDDKANRSAIAIFREAGNGKRSVKRVDLDAIRAGEAPDPALAPGDVIVVDASRIKELLQSAGQAGSLARVFVPFL